MTTVLSPLSCTNGKITRMRLKLIKQICLSSSCGLVWIAGSETFHRLSVVYIQIKHGKQTVLKLFLSRMSLSSNMLFKRNLSMWFNGCNNINISYKEIRCSKCPQLNNLPFPFIKIYLFLHAKVKS